MSIEVVMSFGGVQRAEADVERTVRLVPVLTAGLLRSCDVAARPGARSLLLRLCLAAGPATAPAIDRLRFWSARAHGVAIALGSNVEPAEGAVAAALEGSDLLERGVSPEELPRTLDRALAALWPAAPRVEVGALPVLTISLAGRRPHDLRYDARRRLLSIATRLAPPVGDELVVSVTCDAPTRQVRGGARVVHVGRAKAPEHHRGGFVVSLAVEPPLCRELARIAASRRDARVADGDFRRARFVHAGTARRGATEDAATLRGISTAGAFLATTTPAPLGELVLVTVRLPAVGERTLRAVVERVAPKGMIVRFTLDAHQQTALAAGVAALAARPRRVLLIERNRECRAETAQALRAEGLEVLTARVTPSGALRRRPGNPFDAVVARCTGRDDARPLLGALREISRREGIPVVVAAMSLASSFEGRLLRAEADEIVPLSTSPARIARVARAVLDGAPLPEAHRDLPRACAATAATSVAL